VEAACAVLRKAGLREQVMVDCSHANSSKQHRRQIEVAADIARQIEGGERRIIGVMVESHLHEGRQDLVPGRAAAERRVDHRRLPGLARHRTAAAWPGAGRAPAPRPVNRPYKIPRSVLVVIHTPALQVLLIERADRPATGRA
jgi:hypothetical protein